MNRRFDHEKLEVYQESLTFIAWLEPMLQKLPKAIAVREGLKLIKLKNVKEKSAMKMTFEGGVLEMHVAYAQGAGGLIGDNEIYDMLMKGL
jgi:hypothetical protein